MKKCYGMWLDRTRRHPFTFKYSQRGFSEPVLPWQSLTSPIQCLPRQSPRSKHRTEPVSGSLTRTDGFPIQDTQNALRIKTIVVKGLSSSIVYTDPNAVNPRD